MSKPWCAGDTLCVSPLVSSILEAVRPPQSASTEGENCAVAFCSSHLCSPLPTMSQQWLHVLLPWQVPPTPTHGNLLQPPQPQHPPQLFLADLLLLFYTGCFPGCVGEIFLRKCPLLFPLRILVLVCLEGTQRNVT